MTQRVRIALMRWTTPVQGTEIPMESSEGESSTVLVLAHGAGSSMSHKTVLWLTSLAEKAGLTVVRFNFPYRVLGKSMPDRMPTLTESYRSVVQSVREQLHPDRLLIGGHSMGGRVASHVLAETPDIAEGLVLFGYPLHPAGKPEKLRVDHLQHITVPTLQVNGTKDELCTPSLMEAALENLDAHRWQMHWVAEADHSYSVTKASGRTRAQVEDELASTLAEWMLSVKQAP